MPVTCLEEIGLSITTQGIKVRKDLFNHKTFPTVSYPWLND